MSPFVKHLRIRNKSMWKGDNEQNKINTLIRENIVTAVKVRRSGGTLLIKSQVERLYMVV